MSALRWFADVQFVTGDHVVVNRQGGEGVRLLEHHANASADTYRVGILGIDVMTIQQHFPGGIRAGDDFVHPVQAAYQGGFAAAGRADHGGNHVTLERDADVLNRFGFAVKGRQILDFEFLSLAGDRAVSSMFRNRDFDTRIHI